MQGVYSILAKANKEGFQMDRNTAINTMRFMERTNLQGAEVPAYFECMKALDAIAKAPEEDSAQNGNATTIGRVPGVGQYE